MKRVLLLLAIMAAMASCSKDDMPSEEGRKTSLVLGHARDFEIDGSLSKTDISQNGTSGLTFSWKEGDVIGVIPMDGETIQSNYRLKKVGSNVKEAQFDCGVWEMKEGSSYASYYPFKKKAAVSGETLTLSFDGQISSGGMEHLGDYDYMYAPCVASAKHGITFEFSHLVSLLRFDLTLPAGKYQKVTIESEGDWFASEASLSLSTGEIQPKKLSNTATLDLSGVALSSDSVLTAWLSVLPTAALSGKPVMVKAFIGVGYYEGMTSAITAMEAGKAYCYELKMMEPTILFDYVDLGLSVNWATCNLGAEKPEQFGDFFQWAGTKSVTDESISLSWSNCPYHSGSDFETGWTGYIPSGWSQYWSGEGKADNKTHLDPVDDAAHCQWDYGWRIPTQMEWNELNKNCTWIWTVDYNGSGINGMLVTSNVPGYTDRSIFLPAAGYRSGTRSGEKNSVGNYWSSDVENIYPSCGYFMEFSDGSIRDDKSGYRYNGYTVRPVF